MVSMIVVERTVNRTELKKTRDTDRHPTSVKHNNEETPRRGGGLLLS